MIEKVGLSLNKIGGNTDEIDITAVGFEIEGVTSEGEQLGCVLVDLILVDSHLVFGDVHAPLLDQFANELHGLILE